MITTMINERKGHTATVIFVATDNTGITGNILFKVNNGQEERIIGNDQNVTVGIFYILMKKLERMGFQEVVNN